MCASFVISGYQCQKNRISVVIMKQCIKGYLIISRVNDQIKSSEAAVYINFATR
jgi:hypothetical protein